MIKTLLQYQIDQAAHQYAASLSKEDLEYVVQDHNTFDVVGRHIRNTLGLWHDHPVTERWRTDPSSHDIRDGVDCSIDHPDNISNVIRLRIIELYSSTDNTSQK